jgi:hypothetical protein
MVQANQEKLIIKKRFWLISWSQRKIALPFATTGLASTLLKGGTTVMAVFMLLVPFNAISVFIKNSFLEDALYLKISFLTIIDEISILLNQGLWSAKLFSIQSLHRK